MTIDLGDEVRDRHVYILGKTRSGKSTLLVNLSRQDIAQGKGVGFIDPHGDAAEEVLRHIPRDRVADTIYFEPREYPIGLQGLAASDEAEAELMCDDISMMFRRLSESWGERMDAILRFALTSLLRVPGTTFLDLYTLLTDEDFRKHIVTQLREPRLLKFWTEEYPRFPRDAAVPITTRLSRFIVQPTLGRLFGTTDTLDVTAVMDDRKILVVNLSRVGEDTKTILGSIIVSQIQIAALRRARTSSRTRAPFYLFIDEFQRFSGESFERILSEAGKFKLCLTLAHQGLYQLQDKTEAAVLANVGTMILFALGPDDADLFEKHMGYEGGREKHWVGASGERTMHIGPKGYSPRDLRPFEAIVVHGTESWLTRTQPLPMPLDDCSAEIKNRMMGHMPAPTPRSLPAIPDDFDVAPSPPPKT